MNYRLGSIFLFIGLSIQINGFCQRGLQSTPNTTFLYYGIINPVTVLYENIDCDSIVIESKSCEIKNTQNCMFQVRPNEVGELTFYVRNHNAIIDTFSIRSTLAPAIEVRPKKRDEGGTYPPLVAESPLIKFGYNFTVEKFKMQLIRGDSIWLDKEVIGDTWLKDEDVEKLGRGDFIDIYQVYIKTISPDGEESFQWTSTKIRKRIS